MADELTELQTWYRAQCNGDWEHRYGLTIGTLDNPGWSVEIDLTGTALASRRFKPIKDLAPTQDWLQCEVKDGKFVGHGGPTMLKPILRAFLSWANG